MELKGDINSCGYEIVERVLKDEKLSAVDRQLMKTSHN
jgi:hypothetical protein